MKRYIAAILCALMIVSLVACKADTTDKEQTDAVASTVTDEATTAEKQSDEKDTTKKDKDKKPTKSDNKKETEKTDKKEDDTTTTQAETLPKEITDSKVTPNGALYLTDGIYVTAIEKYSGEYIEDGSNDKLKNIISATVINTTEKSYQLFEFSLTFPQGTYHFSVKSLFAHSQVKVLESGRNFMPSKTDEVTGAVETQALFYEDPSVHLDKFEITYADSVINVKNITDKPIDNVYVYYKSVEDDIFFGGITYRVKVGTVPPDQIVQVMANNFKADTSKIVFVTFGE